MGEIEVLRSLPTGFVVAAAFVFGLAIGSFLCYRVPELPLRTTHDRIPGNEPGSETV